MVKRGSHLLQSMVLTRQQFQESEKMPVRFLKNQKSNKTKKKRVKPQKYPQIDEMMLEWFEEARDRNYVINDEIIKQTALVFGSDLGLTDFKASSSWVLGFKKSMESNIFLFMVKLHQSVKQWWMITKHNLRG